MKSRRNGSTTKVSGLQRVYRLKAKANKTPAIWQIVGYKNSGKTTLVCALIERLREQGYSVAVIKHDMHGFEVDQPDTDTWKHRQAGASATAITNGVRTARMEEKGMKLQELIQSYQSYDYILVEGFKHEGYPKIVLIRDDKGLELLSLNAVKAVITWESMKKATSLLTPSEIPQYDINNVDALIKRMQL